MTEYACVTQQSILGVYTTEMHSPLTTKALMTHPSIQLFRLSVLKFSL